MYSGTCFSSFEMMEVFVLPLGVSQRTYLKVLVCTGRIRGRGKGRGQGRGKGRALRTDGPIQGQAHPVAA